MRLQNIFCQLSLAHLSLLLKVKHTKTDALSLADQKIHFDREDHFSCWMISVIGIEIARQSSDSLDSHYQSFGSCYQLVIGGWQEN